MHAVCYIYVFVRVVSHDVCFHGVRRQQHMMRCNVAMNQYSGLGGVRAAYVQYVSQWFWESGKTSQQSFEEQRVYRASYMGWQGGVQGEEPM
jgi:hypothetical protein